MSDKMKDERIDADIREAMESEPVPYPEGLHDGIMECIPEREGRRFWHLYWAVPLASVAAVLLAVVFMNRLPEPLNSGADASVKTEISLPSLTISDDISRSKAKASEARDRFFQSAESLFQGAVNVLPPLPEDEIETEES